MPGKQDRLRRDIAAALGGVRYLTEAEVVKLTTLSGRTIRRYEQAGRFPPRRKLGPGRIAWLQSEVELWMEARAARADY